MSYVGMYGEEGNEKVNSGKIFGNGSVTFTIRDIMSSSVDAPEVIRGFEMGAEGMEVGETKMLVCPPHLAYGDRDEEEMMDIPASEFPEGVKVGTRLKMAHHTEEGGVDAWVAEIGEEWVKIDANNPLAGKTLHYKVTLKDIEYSAQTEYEEEMGGPVEVETVEGCDGEGGSPPFTGDRCVVHYKGLLASNGVEFDSSYSRNEPFAFHVGLGHVIEGWDEGLMKMTLGQRALLHIPSAKAYGKTGQGPIPPDADLVFDVHLLEIQRGVGGA